MISMCHLCTFLNPVNWVRFLQIADVLKSQNECLKVCNKKVELSEISSFPMQIDLVCI